ncbi:PREDICTED: glycosyltransferase 8 domain-containing protein 1 [Cyprinodon variegatus]|uniref:Glycosyltransferase 8 domain-containing protein 1 n=1 Tax=Cyprinodon variegatus TaxID=28743 RepID=A0A3Q2E0Q0_CYPVA|nr:PREDICTED: glycosyltransferase 8 domain-containing protein 1 [Cyprinodon variegatus]
MTLRRVNVVILILLAVAFLIIVQRNLLKLSDFLHKENSDAEQILPFEAELSPQARLKTGAKGEEISVLITAAEDRLGGVIAAINSVHHNSKANVAFTIVTPNDTVDHLKAWMSNTKLKEVKYKIVIFQPELLNGKIPKDTSMLDAAKPLTFARFYLPVYIPDAEKAIYLDDDVVVQGDIQELYETSLKPGHAAAFSDDCDSASAKGIVRGAGNQINYMGFLDFKKEAIKKLGMRANTCSFNPGVIIANLTEWKNQNITQQLEHWMELNSQVDLYSSTLAESLTTPPLLIVFYKRHSSIDPRWHLRHLGTTGAGNRYSAQYVRAAKLLHWNGHYKPWMGTSSFTEVWDQWFIPDPTGKFHPVRRHAD